jgi:hypothetical protein
MKRIAIIGIMALVSSALAQTPATPKPLPSGQPPVPTVEQVQEILACEVEQRQLMVALMKEPLYISAMAKLLEEQQLKAKACTSPSGRPFAWDDKTRGCQ